MTVSGGSILHVYMKEYDEISQSSQAIYQLPGTWAVPCKNMSLGICGQLRPC